MMISFSPIRESEKTPIEQMYDLSPFCVWVTRILLNASSCNPSPISDYMSNLCICE